MKRIEVCRRAMLMIGAAAGAIAMGAGPVLAQDAPRIDLAPQPLASALYEFGRQTGHQVIFSPGLTKSKTTRGVLGGADEQLAMVQLLAGTGLTFRREGNTFMIEEGAAPQGASAGDGAETNVVQELVVTAQKKQENIQVVPIAISAFTQKDLTTRQIAGGPDLMTQVPNMTFTKTNFTGYSIQIRGIGTQAVSATVDPAVAVAFNNTPFIRNRFFEQEFYDLERLEVLRGPQGTLYGRNATAGVVNLISAKPNYNEFQAKASGDIANYGSKRLEGMINLPLVEDKAGLRLAGAWTKRDGFVTNTIAGEQTDGRDLWSARATLGLEPTSWFKANLIYEHFSENDDRLRSGKQLCRHDPGPAEVEGTPISESGNPVFRGPAVRVYWTQGCLPASLYSPDSFQVPNGFALPYGPAAGLVGAPVDTYADPYLSATQSSNLREIETRVRPDYEASTDTVELQLQFQLPGDLTLASETGFNHDFIFSFEDFNRFNTRPGIFIPDGHPLVSPEGVVCDPQLGCSDRMTVGDLSTAKSLQFSQEFRLSSNYDGPFNFSVGANFLRYDTEDKYYVFFNTLGSVAQATGDCDVEFYYGHGGENTNPGFVWSNPTHSSGLFACVYQDKNNIHNLNDEGRNYFLSRNPYHLLSYAAFGEVYYQITPDLKLTGGFRWTDDKKQAPQIPSWLLAGDTYGTPTLKVIEQEWKEPTGRLAIDWRPKLSFTDETLLYASYTHGYKAGGANPPGYIVVGVPVNYPFGQAQEAALTHPETFAPEFVNAYEIGTKNTLLDGSLTFNLNAFYYDYTGYQISQIIDRSAVNLNFDAEIWGSELEIDWRPLKNLRLGLKGGYENTRMAKGSSAIDLMDRTAGHPGWLVRRPFPTIPSNCIVPVGHALDTECFAYLAPDLLPFTAPNNGQGFAKDLSGNELPNAPHFTTTLTADYTLPLPRDWLVTLHGDVYRQSEAWTRIFNMPGYDRLKAYANVNVAAIFSNETLGLQAMVYVKNIFDKDNITGAFLNSDDTALTTNVFLNEPRLYGIRVTKTWTGDAPMGAWFGEHKQGAPYPFRLELDGDYGRFGQGHERLAPPNSRLFNADFPMPEDGQKALDSGGVGGVKLTYVPGEGPWTVSASLRYGRALGQATPHAKQALPDTCQTLKYRTRCTNPSTNAMSLDGVPYSDGGGLGLFNFYDATTHNRESHAIADFMLGRDFGIGSGSRHAVSSNLSAGLGYVQLGSEADVVMHARPDYYFAPQWDLLHPPHPTSSVHRLSADLQADRKFEGVGPALAWNGSMALLGDADTLGRVDLDLGLGASVLFGKQKARVQEHLQGAYTAGLAFNFGQYDVTPRYDTTLDHVRIKSVTVPAGQANLGLSYELGRMKVSGGYRWERYFKAIDAGLETRKTYDRSFDGPYVKVSVGFGG